MRKIEDIQDNWYAVVERQNNLEKCIDYIKDLLPNNELTIEEYRDMVAEIKDIIRGCEDAC